MLHGVDGPQSGPDVSPAPSVGLARQFPATDLDVRTALRDIRTHLEESGISDDTCGSVEIVLAEVLNNIVEHAYENGNGTIDLSLIGADGALRCDVRDHGRAFAGGATPTGDMVTGQGALSDLPEGGFGWFLIRQLVRDIDYVREDGENRLRLLIDIV